MLFAKFPSARRINVTLYTSKGDHSNLKVFISLLEEDYVSKTTHK